MLWILQKREHIDLQYSEAVKAVFPFLMYKVTPLIANGISQLGSVS